MASPCEFICMCLIEASLGKNLKISSCLNPQGIDSRAYRVLINIYQVCSNYVPLAKNGPTSASHILRRLIYGTHKYILV